MPPIRGSIRASAGRMSEAKPTMTSTGPHPETPRIGKSLWNDAWRKLRRNRVAMISLGALVLVILSAFFTPLIPLQPSDQVQTSRQFTSPTFVGHPADRLKISLEEIRQATHEAEELRKTSLAETAGDDDTRQAFLKERIHDTYMRPYRDAGFSTDIGPLTRWMIRARITLFGDYSIPSLCGRDQLGRDTLARIFWGARVSLIVGLVATLVSLVIGVSYGAISGYFGGQTDAMMMRLVDILYSVPFIFVVIFLLTILGEEDVKKGLAQYGINRITIFYVVVGAIYWLTMARVVRGQVLSLKNELFVEAARAAGAGTFRIISRHLVPNVLSVVIVYLTLTIPRVMLFEAFLSFLGLGVQSPDVSWGLLAKEGLEVITPVRTYWWLVVFPSIAIGVTLFALNFFGDSLRDALDPRLRDS
jgi:oligopeptide transport system permease protein